MLYLTYLLQLGNRYIAQVLVYIDCGYSAVYIPNIVSSVYKSTRDMYR